MSAPPPEPGRADLPGISKHLHRHQCSKCGRVWAHEGVFPIGNRSAENIAMHECMCGHIEWDVLGAEPSEEERLAREARLLVNNLGAAGLIDLKTDEQALAIARAIDFYADAQSRAAVERAEKAERTIASLACMLGWMNVPPQDTLERSIKGLRDGAAETARARVKQELEGLARRCCDRCSPLIHFRLAAVQKEQG